MTNSTTKEQTKLDLSSWGHNQTEWVGVLAAADGGDIPEGNRSCCRIESANLPTNIGRKLEFARRIKLERLGA